MSRYGCQSMTAPLRRVLVRRPGDVSRWAEYGWRAQPDTRRIAEEHDALCARLADAGAEVVVGKSSVDGNPDAVYVYDPALVSNRGAILLRPGKEGRRGEPAALADDLAAAGVPIAARLEAPACAEAGDTLWLDERTLLAGRGYRTNDAGIAALARALPGVDVIAYDLPHLRGRGEVLHLLSLISPLDADLALVYLPLLPVRLVQLLEERGIGLVEVPDDEFETLGCNVLALSARIVLALEGNDETRRRLERAGVEVRTYPGDELSRKGDGGPTCLTRPLLRA
jgi:dimethylargininase